MALIKEEAAFKKLDKHTSGFRAIVQGGWDDLLGLLREYPELRTIICPGTRAALVHDFQVAHASRYAEKAKGVRLQDCSGMKVLVIDSQFAIRLKKLDSQLMSSNQPTEQVEAFRKQQQLPGFP